MTFEFNPDESFPHLPNAPIVEAVIAISAAMMTTATAENVKQTLIDELPDYPKRQQTRQFHIEAEFGPANVPPVMPTIAPSSLWKGVRVRTQDERQIAQFNRGEFIFSRLSPYTDWSTFSTEAMRLWQIYCRMSERVEIQRIGLRYINRINHVKLGKLNQYLTSEPQPLKKLKLPNDEFLCRTSHAVAGHPFRINIVQMSEKDSSNDPHVSILLDLDVFTTKPVSCEDGDILGCLEKMRWLKNKAFFSLLKSTAIKTLQ